jgi:hypothetical protein
MLNQMRLLNLLEAMTLALTPIYLLLTVLAWNAQSSFTSLASDVYFMALAIVTITVSTFLRSRGYT